MDLLTTLKDRPILCDGAMGTQLMAAGMRSGECGELWNLNRPDAVGAIHRAYLDAGCHCIITNTFGGTSIALARHNAKDQTDAINQAGARVARKAAGQNAFVFGDIGPTGEFLEPMGDLSPERMRDAFTQQARALASEGYCDAFIIETMSDPAEMSIAIQAARSAAKLPVIATYAFASAGSEFRTMMGTSAPDCIRAALDAGANIVGANCGTGLSLDDYRHLAETLLSSAKIAPVIIQPNAGSPSTIDGKLHYNATPSDMATLADSLLKLGVKILGGCCGTTPDHLRAMSRAFQRRQSS